MAETILRAVFYARCSDPRQDTSNEDQEAWANEAARRDHTRIIARFSDFGIPGDEMDQREGLNSLLAFCQERFRAEDPPDLLLVWDTDRLSRANSIRTAAVLEKLLDAGITRIRTPEGEIDLTSDVDLTLFNVKQDLTKAAYARSLSKNASRGLLKRALAGKRSGGSKAPYAYRDGPDGHFILGPAEEVRAVQRIFHLYVVEDYSLGMIADRLEAERAPRRSAHPWTLNGVRDVLLNRRYTGCQIYGERHKGKYHKASAKGVTAATKLPHRQAVKRAKGLRNLPQVRNDPSEYIVKENAHPAIVSKELFDAVRTKLDKLALKDGHHERRTTPVKGGGPWVFSGMARCGSCGSKVWGVRVGCKNNGKIYTYRRYQCSHAKRYGKRSPCPPCKIKPEQLRDDVVKVLQEDLLNPRALARLQKALTDTAGQAREEIIRQRRALREKAAALDAQMATGSKRLTLVPDELVDGLLDELKALRLERQAIDQELDNLRTAEGEGTPDSEQLARALQLVEHLGEAAQEMTAQELRSALQPLIQKVTVHYQDGHYHHVEVDLTAAFVNLLAPASP
jgi:DNA invertase Pin-like site-specific DNA recombinase